MRPLLSTDQQPWLTLQAALLTPHFLRLHGALFLKMLRNRNASMRQFVPGKRGVFQDSAPFGSLWNLAATATKEGLRRLCTQALRGSEGIILGHHLHGSASRTRSRARGQLQRAHARSGQRDEDERQKSGRENHDRGAANVVQPRCWRPFLATSLLHARRPRWPLRDFLRRALVPCECQNPRAQTARYRRHVERCLSTRGPADLPSN